jgi:hypothetical protein
MDIEMLTQVSLSLCSQTTVPPIICIVTYGRCFCSNVCVFLPAKLALLLQLFFLQYGAGSGASFGFAASSASSRYDLTSLTDIFRALLVLKPAPDVVSWSWGTTARVDGFEVADVSGLQPRASWPGG